LDNPKIPGPIDITAESIPAKKQQAQQITTKLKAQTLLEKSGISFCRYSILEIYNLLIFFRIYPLFTLLDQERYYITGREHEFIADR
jgi:hypothetical protein